MKKILFVLLTLFALNINAQYYSGCDTFTVREYWHTFNESDTVTTDTVDVEYAKCLKVGTSDSIRLIISTDLIGTYIHEPESPVVSRSPTLVDTVKYKPGFDGADSTMYFLNINGLVFINESGVDDDDLFYNPFDGLNVASGFKSTQIKRDRVRVGDTGNSSSVLIKDGAVTIDRPTGYTPSDNHDITRGESKTLIRDSLINVKLELADKAESVHSHTIGNVTNLNDSLAAHRLLLPPSPVGVTTGKLLGVKINEFKYYTKAELGIKDSSAVDAMIRDIVSDSIAGMGGGSLTVSGANGDIQIKNGSVLSHPANVTTLSGNVLLKNTTIPTGDSTGIIITSHDTGINNEIIATDELNSYVLAPSYRSKRIGYCVPHNGSTFNNSGLAIGAGASIQGTLTAPTLSTTNVHQESNRIDILRTSASASNIAGVVANIANYQIKKAPLFDYIWGPATGVATSTTRSFTGFAASTSVSDVDPSTYVNCYGMGWDDDDSNIQFFHNDGSGTCTKVNLGSNFPVPTSDRTKLYNMFFQCEKNTNAVYYKITDIATGNTTDGTVSTNLPANDTFLGIRSIVSVGGTSSVIGISLVNLYVECNH